MTNQAGTFESGPELPTPRTDSGSTVDDGRFYVAGGIDAWGRTLASFLQYDPVSKRWQALSDLPEPINHPAIVSANGRIYAVGGFGPLGIRLRGFMFAEWHPLDSVYVFDLEAGSWGRGPVMPEARGAGGTSGGSLRSVRRTLFELCSHRIRERRRQVTKTSLT